MSENHDGERIQSWTHIDPQLNGMPCNGVIAEFERAIQEIKTDPNRLPAWQMIIGKYHPTFLGECRNAIEWSEKVVEEWLLTCMFKGDRQRARKASRATRQPRPGRRVFAGRPMAGHRRQ